MAHRSMLRVAVIEIRARSDNQCADTEKAQTLGVTKDKAEFQRSPHCKELTLFAQTDRTESWRNSAAGIAITSDVDRSETESAVGQAKCDSSAL